jgi:hypothetical protein
MFQSANADQFIHKLVPSCCSIDKNLRIYSIRAERELPGKLPRAILGDTWIAVAAEAQFAASMSVPASTDAGIANAAAAPLHKFWHTHFLCFCPNPKCSISTALTTRELFFFKKRITTCNYSNASQKMSRIKSQCCTSFNIYISSHNGLINFHISAQHL